MMQPRDRHAGRNTLMGRILKILVGVVILAGLTAGGYAWVQSRGANDNGRQLLVRSLPVPNLCLRTSQQATSMPEMENTCFN